MNFISKLIGSGVESSTQSTLKNIANDSMSSETYYKNESQSDWESKILQSPKAIKLTVDDGKREVYWMPPCNIVESQSKEDIETYLSLISFKLSNTRTVNGLKISTHGPLIENDGKYWFRLPFVCHLQFIPTSEQAKTSNNVNVRLFSVPETFYKTETCNANDVIDPTTLKLPVPVHAKMKNPPPPLNNHYPPKFDWRSPEDLKKMKDYLDEHGYAVVKEAASAAEVEFIEKNMWEYLSSFKKDEYGPSCMQNDLTTWDASSWICPRDTGVASQYSVGQTDFMHFARGLESISKSFEMVWGENVPLITSFDGMGIFRTPALNHMWQSPDFRWIHVDQGPSKIGFHCCQGQLVIRGNDEVNGVFIVCPGSHKMHEKYMLDHQEELKGRGDFVMLNDAEKAKKYFGEAVKLITSPGDFILWDSRTVHANVPPELPSSKTLYDRQRTEPYNICRLVLYICMMPAKDASPDVVQKRKDFITKGITTTHWPAECKASGYAKENYKISKYLQLPERKEDISEEEYQSILRRRKLCSLDPYSSS